MNTKNGMRPVHLGKILHEEFDALGLSANALWRWLIWLGCRATSWKHYRPTAPVSTAFGSTRNGAFASVGLMHGPCDVEIVNYHWRS